MCTLQKSCALTSASAEPVGALRLWSTLRSIDVLGLRYCFLLEPMHLGSKSRYCFFSWRGFPNFACVICACKHKICLLFPAELIQKWQATFSLGILPPSVWLTVCSTYLFGEKAHASCCLKLLTAKRHLTEVRGFRTSSLCGNLSEGFPIWLTVTS